MPIVGAQNPKQYPVEESVVVVERDNTITYLHQPTNRLWTIRKENHFQGNNLPSPTLSRMVNTQMPDADAQRVRTIKHPDITE